MKWISVKDELPKLHKGIYGGNNSDWVLAWNEDYNSCYILVYYGDDKVWRDGYLEKQMKSSKTEITHWMYLPEKP